MVKSKNYLVESQLALVFLIPVTPHIEISNILQLDDIPILLFFVLFAINIYSKNISTFVIFINFDLFYFWKKSNFIFG